MTQDPDPYRIRSDFLDKTLIVGSNTPKVDAHCPIDKTQLIWVNEIGTTHYACPGCEATYSDKTPESLQEQARTYVKEIEKRFEGAQKEIAQLERIICAANFNGVQGRLELLSRFPELRERFELLKPAELESKSE